MPLNRKKKHSLYVNCADPFLYLPSSIGTKVVEVKATDDDDPNTANGELRYSLIRDHSAFEINNVTGLFFVCFRCAFVTSLDYESVLTPEVTLSLSAQLCYRLSQV